MKKEISLATFIYVGLALVLFSLPLIQEGTIVPFNVLSLNDNVFYRDNVDLGQKNTLLYDTIFQFYPWKAHTDSSIHNGVFPLWNPYTQCGLPFVANSQSSVFEFTKILSYFFKISTSNFFVFSNIITLFLAGFFTYLYLRNRKLKLSAAILGGVVFMLSGPIIVWLGYPLVSTVIWLPLILFIIDKIIDSKKKLWIGLLALVIGLQFFGGNPEISWFVLFTAFLYALWQLWFCGQKKKQIFERCIYLVIGLFIGLAIASVQIIPTLEFLMQSQAMETGRGGLAEAHFFQALTQWNGWHNLKDIKHSLENLVLVIYPDFLGHPVKGQYWGSANYSESAIYFGLVPLFFIVWAIKSINRKYRRDVVFWTILLSGTLLVIISAPVFRLVGYLPIFKLLAMGRLRFIFVFSAAILAAIGFDLMFSKKGQLKKILVWLNSYALVIIASLISFSYIWYKLAAESISKKDLVIRLSLWLVLVLIVNLVFVMRRYLKRGDKYLWLMLLIVVLELISYGHDYHPISNEFSIDIETREVFSFLDSNLDHYRIASYKESLIDFRTSFLPNINVLWRIPDIRGYEIIKVRRFDELENLNAGVDDRFLYKKYNSQYFNNLSVKYLIQGKNDVENKMLQERVDLKQVLSNDRMNIYENISVLPRAYVVYQVHQVSNLEQALSKYQDGEMDYKKEAIIEVEDNKGVDLFDLKKSLTEAEIVGYGINQVRVKVATDKPGLLILTDAYYEGWKAYIDGIEAEIFPANVAFRGVFVPHGSHEITFKYHPKSFYYSIWLSLSGLVIVILLILGYLKNKKYAKN